jgi:predicted transposase YdaD
MKRNDDILWKAALEDLFDDFLRFFYPDADQLFDLDKGFQYLDKELEQLFPPEPGNYAPRYVDKLVKVFTRSGGEEWILVHIEVQGYTDHDFAKRMYQYFYRIQDQYDKPVTAFAIFADSSKTFHPKFYKREFLGTRIYYEYNTLKIIDQNDAELEASNNPFAMAVLSAKLFLSRNSLNDQQVFDLAYDLAKRLLKKQMPKDKIRKVMNFLRYYRRFENPEMFAKFEQEISILTERNITMGIEEFLLDRAEKQGIEKGIELGIEQGIEKGMEQGIEKGIEQGIEKGIEQGIELGIEKGKHEETLAIAREMKKDCIPVAQIQKFTRLSVAEIEKL